MTRPELFTLIAQLVEAKGELERASLNYDLLNVQMINTVNELIPQEPPIWTPTTLAPQ